MGCEITDTVLLAFEGDVPEQWLEYVCRETLGRPGDIVNPESVIEIGAEEGKWVRIFVSKASDYTADRQNLQDHNQSK